jgi:hypothetical protein
MNSYILKLASLMVLILGLEKIILIAALPQHNFAALPAIPVFFILFGAIMIKLVYSKPNPSVAVLLGAKMLKIMLSLVIILAYVLLIKENNLAFLISYMIYFLAYLVYETWMLSVINKKK